MLNDLTTNYKLVGLKVSEVVELLGKTDYKDSILLAYEIENKYGSDIDPIYTKTLELAYSRDSIVSSFKIHEWKK